MSCFTVDARASSVTFLVLVFGVIWGVIFYGETLNGSAIVGGVTVLVGVALVLKVLLFKRKADN
ncbi:MAG: EamA family transporter [Burkholderiales bacterium]|nr:EamA family transporter [Burkholderiales bacterium]